MSERRSPRAGDLFADALEIPAAERGAWLDSRCRGDAALRREVESLLNAHAAAGDFLAAHALDEDRDEPAGGAAVRLEDLDHEADDLTGHRVGAYRLLRPIGSGGMSRVWLGERVAGDFEQTVAVKVIMRGMASDHVLRRFRQERRVLAGLEHPHIARLIDGGSTADGRPYLVMEYVDGRPIDAYCRDERLDLAARLKLFRTVCEAVRHAHGRLVVHRDLKPSNILVTADGRVKLLDFGIAKVLRSEDDETGADLTLAQQRLLTPRYASPEQIRGEAVTTATDVYSLGVLLYELLTEHPPYDLPSTSARAAERVICETEPRRPSLVAPERENLKHALAGDLDTIVLKALHKDPRRRYESVEQFAEDLRRYDEGLPVLARPDTARYRAGKFVRRNLPAVVAGGLVVLALAGATIVSTAHSMRSERARAEAETQRRTAARVSAFLQDLITMGDPVAVQSDSSLTVAAAIERAAERIDAELADEPEVAAALNETVARTYLGLGRLHEAERHAAAALALRRGLGADGPSAGRAAQALIGTTLLAGRVWRQLGNHAAADSLLRGVLPVAMELDGGRDPLAADVLRQLADVNLSLGDQEEARRLAAAAIRRREASSGDQAEALALDHNSLGLILVHAGEPAAAREHLREALRLMTEARDGDHTYVGQINANLGWALTHEGRWEEAIPHLETALARYDGILTAGHPHVLAARGNLARAYQMAGRWDEAERLHREVIEGYRSRYGDRHENVAHCLNNYALMLEEAGRDPEAAAALYDEAREIYQERLGAEHPWTAIARHNRARALRLAGELDAAEDECRAALAVRRRVLREDHPDIARSEALLSAILTDRGGPAEDVRTRRASEAPAEVEAH